MIAFGHLPRTRIRDADWTDGGEAVAGVNNVFGGIEVARGPNMAGVWAQEYWEWRLHFLWTALAVASLVAGAAALWWLQRWWPTGPALLVAALALLNDRRDAAGREIYSHAITLEAALMLALPCSEDEMVGSLASYSYCQGISRDRLLTRLREARPKAREWCEANRAKIARLTVM